MPKVFHVLILSILVSIAWGEPIRISPPQVNTAMHRPDIRESAAVADSKGVVHVAFHAFSQDLRRNVIMYARVGPGERAAHTELLTSSAPGVLPDLIWTKEGLYAAWSEKADQGGVIGFASSKDSGKTWVRTVLPLRTERETAARLFAGSGGDVFVYGSARVPELGTQDHEIYCFRSTDGGKSWTNASPTLDLEGQSTDPFMIEVKPGHVAMAWVQTDGRSWRVTTRRSSDGGQTWEGAELVDDNPRFPAAEPSLIPVGKRLIALWVETTASGKRLVADAFENGGWGKDRVLSGKEVTEMRYDASSDSKGVRVAYLAKSGSGSLRRYKLFVLPLDPARLSDTKALPEPKIVHESFHSVDFDSVDLKSGPAVGASYRVSSLMWKISLFGKKTRLSGDILPLAPDLGGRERALLFLLPLPDGLGVLYREQRARQVPPPRYGGELWLERVKFPK